MYWFDSAGMLPELAVIKTKTCGVHMCRFDRVVSACCLDKDFETFGAGDRVEVSVKGCHLPCAFSLSFTWYIFISFIRGQIIV